ncbi:MAG TPA: alpha-amylase family glycosyl hydrolase [Candidatus Acidoferrum sp.]|nr:alpha-amylase family glycosyl hydrolase [Candidatus Acidoferrum sp.]
MKHFARCRKVAVALLFALFPFGRASLLRGDPQTPGTAPVVTKVEPPNWWVGLTPDLMVLLSGHGLQATKVACNLPDVVVGRTQATQGGEYLFVWLKFGPQLRSGTAVCRATTPTGEATFELPIATRQPTAQRFHGLNPDDVVYLIMPDRFADGDAANDEPAEFPGSYDRAKPRAWHGGDLKGVRDHVSYLKDLGITTLWLTPVVKNGSTQDYHGYGAVDLYAVDPHLGSLDDYKSLASDLRKERMKLFFDAVPNHVGPKHPWVLKPPMPDWFHGSAERHLDSNSPMRGSFYGKGAAPAANDPFETLADPHATQSMRQNLTNGWFFGILPDLNTENPAVAKYLLQNSIWWIESTGLDGLRLDTFPYVSRTFWQQWHAGLRRIYPNLTTVGEVFHPDPVVTSFFAGGQKGWDGIDTGLSTVFDFPLFFAIRDVLLRGAPAGRIANVLRQDELYPHSDWLVPFFANHDVPRMLSEPGGSPEKLLSAFALTLTLRGIPELYYGDEIGMTGGGDPENRHDFPGGWPGDARNAFTQEGRTAEQQKVFASVQKLLQLRRRHAALRTGKLFHLFSDDGSYVFLRQTDDERMVVVFNNQTTSRELVIRQSNTPADNAVRVSLLYGAGLATTNGQELRITAPPQSVSIFSLD